MNSQEAVNALDNINDDPETSHIKADDTLLDFLRSSGYEDVAKAWEGVSARCDGFWYS